MMIPPEDIPAHRAMEFLKPRIQMIEMEVIRLRGSLVAMLDETRRHLKRIRSLEQKMAKRWNGKKMSHGKKNLVRPIKKPRQAKKK